MLHGLYFILFPYQLVLTNIDIPCHILRIVVVTVTYILDRYSQRASLDTLWLLCEIYQNLTLACYIFEAYILLIRYRLQCRYIIRSRRKSYRHIDRLNCPRLCSTLVRERCQDGRRITFIKSTLLERIVSYQAITCLIDTGIHIVLDDITHATPLPDTDFIYRTLQHIRSLSTIILTTQEQLTCLDGRKNRSHHLLLSHTIEINRSRTRCTLQHIDSYMVPLVVSHLVRTDCIISAIHIHLEQTSLINKYVELILVIESEDIRLTILFFLSTEPEFSQIAFLMGCGNLGSIHSHDGLSVQGKCIILAC